MTRQEANIEILNIIGELIARHPDLRFGQLLYGFDVMQQRKDDFYTESVDILHRVVNNHKLIEDRKER